MGKARKNLDAMLAVGDPTTVGGATLMLKAKLGPRWASCRRVKRDQGRVHLHPDPRAPPAAPTATPTGNAVGRRHDEVRLQGGVHLQGRQDWSCTTRSPPTPAAPKRPTPQRCRTRSSTRRLDQGRRRDGLQVLRAMTAAGDDHGTYSKVGTTANGANRDRSRTRATATADTDYVAETKAYAGSPWTCAPDDPGAADRGRGPSQLGLGKGNVKGCEDDVYEDGTPRRSASASRGELPVDLGIPGPVAARPATAARSRARSAGTSTSTSA